MDVTPLAPLSHRKDGLAEFEKVRRLTGPVGLSFGSRLGSACLFSLARGVELPDIEAVSARQQTALHPPHCIFSHFKQASKSETT